MNSYELTDDELERQTLYYGRLGPSYDDVRPVFVIDGRDYPDAAAVRGDVLDAGCVLDRHGIVAEIESEIITPATWRLDLPTWREYRARHFPDDPPIA